MCPTPNQPTLPEVSHPSSTQKFLGSNLGYVKELLYRVGKLHGLGQSSSEFTPQHLYFWTLSAKRKGTVPQGAIYLQCLSWCLEQRRKFINTERMGYLINSIMKIISCLQRVLSIKVELSPQQNFLIYYLYADTIQQKARAVIQ